MEQAQTELQNSYDRVAKAYAKRFYDELDRKPFDRKVLDWFVEKVDGLGTICDLGCGCGHIANYLHSGSSEPLRDWGTIWSIETANLLSCFSLNVS